MLQPPSAGCFVWFSLIFSRRGGSTSSILTLDTAVDESRKKMADRVTRSPARLCSRDGKLCFYGRLEYDFVAFFPCFQVVLFLLPYPGMFLIFVLLRPCSIHLLSSKYVFLCHLYPASSRGPFCFVCFVFFVVLIPWLAF